MASLLETLSVELVEVVVTNLDLNDIGSLRLTNRAIREKASQKHFLSFFTHKSITLSTDQLQKMVLVMIEGSAGCYLQHCTIIGIAEPSVLPQETGGIHLRLLTAAFKNLQRYSVSGGIASLCLHITATPVHAAKPGVMTQVTSRNKLLSSIDVWQAATTTCMVTMNAVRESGLLVHDRLDLFGEVKGCSLSYGVFQHFFGQSANLWQRFLSKPAALLQNFRSIKCLKLSISAPNVQQKDENGRFIYSTSTNNDQEKYCTITLQILLEMIQLMPNLEELDLHWYNVVTGGFEEAHTSRTVSEVSTSALPSLKPLKRCALRGIYCNNRALLHFIKAVRPAALILEFIQVASRTQYDEMFNHLTDPTCQIEELLLEDLCVNFQLAHFRDLPGHPKFPYMGQSLGPSVLSRKTDEMKKPISYELPDQFARPLGSPMFGKWLWNKGDNFGKPYANTYSFHTLNSLLIPSPAD